MKLPCKVSPIFQGNTITIPLAEPIILKGSREDKNFAFIFNHHSGNYYIFATLHEGVINNNLPGYLDAGIKELLIESVNQYCEKSRDGLPDNIFVAHLKKNALCWPANNLRTNSIGE